MDVFKFLSAYLSKDAKNPVNIPLKFVDSGDGTYSLPVSAFPAIAADAGGRLRMSQLTTLFDGKHLNADEPDLWHGVLICQSRLTSQSLAF